LEGRFEFVYNGSVLDNVFDPGACVRNVSRMLKEGGVVMHYEGAMHCFPAYLKFSPEWFFDYYARNRFEDAQVYLCSYADVYKSAWDTFEWDAFVNLSGKWEPAHTMQSRADAIVVAVAEKGGTASINGN